MQSLPQHARNDCITHLNDLPQGAQAQTAWGKPARSKTERHAHVLRMLESENKLWIATASPDGRAHLVPFSFLWDGQRLSMATKRGDPAARNAGRTGKARVALGNFGDVVLIDGPVAAVSPQEVDDALAERLQRVSAIDAQRAGLCVPATNAAAPPGMVVRRRARESHRHAGRAMAHTNRC